MSLVVKKIGGSLLKSDEDFTKIAAYLTEAYRKNPCMIVVVSALQGETDRLIFEAENLSSMSCHARELLLSLGEQKSCALLGLALNKQGIPYTILSGTQVGISKGENGDYKVNKAAYETALQSGIVIVSGFHVVDTNLNLVNLGRGGSDFTAILLAHSLKADTCELLKDVPGVFNTQPEWGPLGQFFETLSFDQMLTLSGQGVPIVQHEALVFAKQHKIPFYVTNLSGQGTSIKG